MFGRNPRDTPRRSLLVHPLAAAAFACVALMLSKPVCGQPQLSTVAVFPVENLSGGLAPVDEIRQYLMETIAAHGVTVLGPARLDAFMTQHRVRYAAGIDAPTAEALRAETGVDAIVLASIELSSEAPPPKLALIVRLVSIVSEPTVVWAEDAGLAGDDAPGLFELGLVNDYQQLLAKALNRVSESLLARIVTGETLVKMKAASKFRPKNAFREITLDRDRTYSVAVVPFVNLSDRRNAGDVLTLLFMRHLSAFPQLRVVDSGVVRRQLLEARIIMDGGPSLRDAETIAALIDADFVLGGRVTRYQDYEGAGGKTRVEFSTVMIERKSRRVVWSSDSSNEGTDGIRLFERGASKTAHAMATQMVRLTAAQIAQGDR
jgi:TolB-like protein